jgi:uncharacterized protein YegP (UPF0339 family)
MGDTDVKRVEIYRDSGDQFRWRALAGNGEIVSEGEAYTREHDAERSAQEVFGSDVTLIRPAAE